MSTELGQWATGDQWPGMGHGHCTCPVCCPAKFYSVPFEWHDRGGQEQAKRDAENLAKLQALMQKPSVFEGESGSAQDKRESIRVYWQEVNGFKGESVKEFLTRKEADTFARQLVDQGIAKSAAALVIFARYGEAE